VWDPQRYLVFGDERARPFHDLLAAVGAQNPAEVVDLGCGPGNLTATLAQRWPSARVVGVDSSARWSRPPEASKTSRSCRRI
jgi:trans-aconitate 2-methyltransferase